MNTSQNNNSRKNINKKADRRKKYIKNVSKRLSIVFFIIIAILIALIVIVVFRAIDNSEEYSRKVLEHQGYDDVTIPYKRGDITDRNGAVLATNEKIYNLILDPYIILSNENITEPTINALVSCYGYDKEELYKIINENNESSYLRFSKGLTLEEMERFTTVEELVNNDKTIRDVIDGVWFEEEYRRVYPYNTLACDLIGFTNSDATEGYYGLEKFYNDELTGSDGRLYGTINSDTNYDVTVKEAVAGYDIVTTIDTNLQNIIEKRITEFNEKVGSKNTAVLIMDPNNGEVLTMASYPVFDLNAPYDLSSFFTETELELMSETAQTEFLSNLWSNFNVSYDYEPGSTAKPFTVATGLEEAKIRVNDVYPCDGNQVVGGWTIKCHVTSGHGELSLTDALVNSCNDCLMQIAGRIGSGIFCDYQSRFGLGQLTGIDLPSETSGILHNPEAMQEVDLATSSFGQTYTATVVQMASAYCSLINGGTYYKPHVVKQVLSEDGSIIEEVKPEVVNQTISSTTSKFLVDAMVKTIDNSDAAIVGYSIGGKTGTAQKLPREDNTYIVSLATFFPAYNPEIMMFVVIDEPNVENQSAGGYATALSHDIMADIIEYYNIEPDRTDEAYNTQFSSDVVYDENGVIIED